MLPIHLFYKHGRPTDIIYNGNHTQFTITKIKDKYVYTAKIDQRLFVHDATHILAVFLDDYTTPTVYHCNEKKDNKKLHGAGMAHRITNQPF
jgi:hypothetical protein